MARRHQEPRMVQGAIFVAILLLSGAPLAQNAVSSPQTSAVPDVVGAASNSTLLISARAKNGALGELTAADIEVKEDGKQVPVQQIRKLNQAPLHYCVVFDTSNSERFRFKFQQELANELLRQVVRTGTDRGWLALFDVESRQSNEIADPVPITNAISASKPAGPTALYDAVTVCANRMEKSRSEEGLRAMFVFSDGGDNQSRQTSEEAVDAALSASTRIYAIDPNQDADRNGPGVLKKLAEDTGGRVFFPERLKDVSSIAAALNDDLQNLFALTYASGTSKSDRRSRWLEVKCTRKDVTVLAPKRVKLSRP